MRENYAKALLLMALCMTATCSPPGVRIQLLQDIPPTPHDASSPPPPQSVDIASPTMSITVPASGRKSPPKGGSEGPPKNCC